MTQLTWHGDALKQQLLRATSAGLQRATLFLHQQTRQAVNIQNTAERRKYKDRTTAGKAKRKARGRNTTSYTVWPHPSRPGEPPRRRTGFLQRNVVREFDERRPAGRVGVSKNALYGLYLELGTKRIARRPWMVATLLKHQVMLGKLACTS